MHVVHLGPFVWSGKGSCYLLVLVDGFAKYVRIYPVKNTNSITLVGIFEQH